MIILEIISKLYTDEHSSWIKDIEETTIQPNDIQQLLSMNDNIRVQIRWLDKYIYVLPTKMYLSLVWSILPKTQKIPLVENIQKMKKKEEFDFVLKKIRKYFKLSDNDYNANKNILIKHIKKDKINMFLCFRVKQSYWKKYHLGYKLIDKLIS